MSMFVFVFSFNILLNYVWSLPFYYISYSSLISSSKKASNDYSNRVLPNTLESVLLSDDSPFTPLDLPFPFQLSGRTTYTLYVSPNGALHYNKNQPCYPANIFAVEYSAFSYCDYSSSYYDAIAGYLTDLNPFGCAGANITAYYSPHLNKYTISFHNFCYFGSNLNNSFDISLFKDASITIAYKKISKNSRKGLPLPGYWISGLRPPSPTLYTPISSYLTLDTSASTVSKKIWSTSITGVYPSSQNYVNTGYNYHLCPVTLTGVCLTGNITTSPITNITSTTRSSSWLVHYSLQVQFLKVSCLSLLDYALIVTWNSTSSSTAQQIIPCSTMVASSSYSSSSGSSSSTGSSSYSSNLWNETSLLCQNSLAEISSSSSSSNVHVYFTVAWKPKANSSYFTPIAGLYTSWSALPMTSIVASFPLSSTSSSSSSQGNVSHSICNCNVGKDSLATSNSYTGCSQQALCQQKNYTCLANGTCYNSYVSSSGSSSSSNINSYSNYSTASTSYYPATWRLFQQPNSCSSSATCTSPPIADLAVGNSSSSSSNSGSHSPVATVDESIQIEDSLGSCCAIHSLDCAGYCPASSLYYGSSIALYASNELASYCCPSGTIVDCKGICGGNHTRNICGICSASSVALVGSCRMVDSSSSSSSSVSSLTSSAMARSIYYASFTRQSSSTVTSIINSPNSVLLTAQTQALQPLLQSDDSPFYLLDLPFPFVFSGRTFYTLYVNPNGALHLTKNQPCYPKNTFFVSNTLCNFNTAYYDVIAGFLTDLNPFHCASTPNITVYYKHYNNNNKHHYSRFSRSVIVLFDQFCYYGVRGALLNNSFSIELIEGEDKIKIRYHHIGRASITTSTTTTTTASNSHSHRLLDNVGSKSKSSAHLIAGIGGGRSMRRDSNNGLQQGMDEVSEVARKVDNHELSQHLVSAATLLASTTITYPISGTYLSGIRPPKPSSSAYHLTVDSSLVTNSQSIWSTSITGIYPATTSLVATGKEFYLCPLSIFWCMQVNNTHNNNVNNDNRVELELTLTTPKISCVYYNNNSSYSSTSSSSSNSSSLIRFGLWYSWNSSYRFIEDIVPCSASSTVMLASSNSSSLHCVLNISSTSTSNNQKNRLYLWIVWQPIDTSAITITSSTTSTASMSSSKGAATWIALPMTPLTILPAIYNATSRQKNRLHYLCNDHIAACSSTSTRKELFHRNYTCISGNNHHHSQNSSSINHTCYEVSSSSNSNSLKNSNYSNIASYDNAALLYQQPNSCTQQCTPYGYLVDSSSNSHSNSHNRVIAIDESIQVKDSLGSCCAIHSLDCAGYCPASSSSSSYYGSSIALYASNELASYCCPSGTIVDCKGICGGGNILNPCGICTISDSEGLACFNSSLLQIQLVIANTSSSSSSDVTATYDDDDDTLHSLYMKYDLLQGLIMTVNLSLHNLSPFAYNLTISSTSQRSPPHVHFTLSSSSTVTATSKLTNVHLPAHHTRYLLVTSSLASLLTLNTISSASTATSSSSFSSSSSYHSANSSYYLDNTFIIQKLLITFLRSGYALPVYTKTISLYPSVKNFDQVLVNYDRETCMRLPGCIYCFQFPRQFIVRSSNPTTFFSEQDRRLHEGGASSRRRRRRRRLFASYLPQLVDSNRKNEDLLSHGSCQEGWLTEDVCS